MDHDRERELQKIAASAEVSPEAIQLIYCAFERLHAVSQLDLDQTRHPKGADLCDALLSFAQEHYGDDFRDVLRFWKLDTSEKVGRCIQVLIEHKWVQPSEGDNITDFVGKFDLSQ